MAEEFKVKTETVSVDYVWDHEKGDWVPVRKTVTVMDQESNG